MDTSDRRRLLLATLLTLVALPALWLLSQEEDSGAPNVATAGVDVEGDSGGSTDGDGSIAEGARPDEPVFMDGPAGQPNMVAEIAVPAAPNGEVATGLATYRASVGRRQCVVPFVVNGTEVTVVNLDNNRRTTCVAVYASAVEGTDVVLHSQTFLELADLTDAPIPVEYRW